MSLFMVDEIDRFLLSQLGKNSRTSSYEMSRYLQEMGYKITDRTVRHRLKRLEKSNTILAYSLLLNPALLSEKINRTILLKFKFRADTSVMISRLEKYCGESYFCIYSARMTGDFDWICHFVFDSIEQYEFESSNFLNRFIDLIDDFRSYESSMVKVTPYTLFDDHEIRDQKWRAYRILNSLKKYHDLNEKFQFIVENLVKHFGAKFARIWLLDRERKNLILKFSAGKYKNIHGEFSKVPADSNKIGNIVITRKPTVTNDVINDKRIRHRDWAKKEKLQSFAGYPITHGSKVIGVLAMFSTRRMQAADFEVLGVFSDQISKELEGLFTAVDFLIPGVTKQ
ncbi:MAG TPA: GAF domain-containing protein [Nitrososphaeraceae archaeon]|nr:GAF domain-containing protein [Nitrososphaeraceae archaeon]